MSIRLAIRYDMRSPSIGTPASQLYPAAIEQVALADEAGFDVLYLAEHHATTDGYCPSPITLAAAMASRTRRIRLHFSAIIAPLHHPVQLAEDLAVLDLVSGGRVEMTLGLGYRQSEYDLFDIERAKRVQILNELIRTLEMAWTGEPFEFRGQTLSVLPRPVQEPHPPIFIGGSTEASARRAAKTAHGYLPAVPSLFDIFADERRRLGGVVPSRPRPKGPLFLFVSDNPDRDWPVVAPHVLYATNATAAMARERGVGATPYPEVTTVEELQRQKQFRVVTPESCVSLIEALGGNAEITLHPLMGGLAPNQGTASLRRFIDFVLPELQARGLWTRPTPGTAALR